MTEMDLIGLCIEEDINLLFYLVDLSQNTT